jgi:transmembrane protein 18
MEEVEVEGLDGSIREEIYDTSEDAGGEGSFEAFMSEVEADVRKMAHESASAPQDFREEWQAFTHAINWTQPWLICILCFEVLLLVTVLLFRNNINVQISVFAVICGIVFCAERINSFCAENSASFADQQYFDEHGVFTGVLLCAPLLTIAFVQLCNMIRLTSNMLITVKRNQLKTQRNTQHKEKEKEKNQKLKGELSEKKSESAASVKEDKE